MSRRASGHAAERMSERFDIKLDSRSLRELIGIINNGTSEPIHYQGGVIRARLDFRGRDVTAVYDVRRGRLVTVYEKMPALPDWERPELYDLSRETWRIAEPAREIVLGDRWWHWAAMLGAAVGILGFLMWVGRA